MQQVVKLAVQCLHSINQKWSSQTVYGNSVDMLEEVGASKGVKKCTASSV